MATCIVAEKRLRYYGAMSQEGLSPESHLTGLHEAAPGRLDFLMPQLGAREVTMSFGYGMEVLQAVLKARDRLPNLNTTIRFVSRRTAGSYVVGIVAAELLDTSVADMIENVGDVAMRAAVDALNDARGESTIEGKRRHRHTAEGALRLAYGGYEDSIRKRKGTFKDWWSPEAREKNHQRASLAAGTIALIHKDEGLQSTATWAERAKTHFDAYYELGASGHAAMLARIEDGTVAWRPDFQPEGRVVMSPPSEQFVANMKEWCEQQLAPYKYEKEQFNAVYDLLVAPDKP